MSIIEKLQLIQQELIAPKNQYNSFGKYNYRSCEDILEGLKPCLKKVKAAVTVSDTIEMVGNRYYVTMSRVYPDLNLTWTRGLLRSMVRMITEMLQN